MARGIHRCPKCLFLRPTSISILWTICVYIHISDCVNTVCALPLLPNNTAVKYFYTNRSGAKCWRGIYHWGAGLAVTGPTRDIGLNVLQSSFQTGSSSSQQLLSHFQTGSSSSQQLLSHFLPYRIPRWSFYCKYNTDTNYIIIFNNNNAVIY
jgi:hypothetical protein